MPIEITPATETDDELPAGNDAANELPAGDDGEAAAGEAGAEGAAGAEGEAGDGAGDELVVTIGDEAAPIEDEKAAPPWVKELRRSDREKTRRIRELEQRLAAAQPVQPAAVAGPRPTLAGCDFDEDKFSAELDAWHGRKRQAEDSEREAERSKQAHAAAWQKQLDGYKQQAAALRVPNFAAAEEAVKDTFSVVQQGLIIKACKQPALMVAALGSNDRKARELAAITDPVEFTAEIARVEVQLKTQTRKPATLPEKAAPRSSITGASAVDGELAKLQERAAKTGDRTQVVRYLQGKAKQAA